MRRPPRVAALFMVLPGLCPSLAAAQIPYSRLLKARSEPGSWLTYSGAYDGWRYSPLEQVNAGNVARASPRLGLPGQGDRALPGAPARRRRRHVHHRAARAGHGPGREDRGGRSGAGTPPCRRTCAPSASARGNRGVALLDDTVYVGTLDALSWPWTPCRAPCAGTGRSPTTSPATASRRRPWPWTARSSSASAAARPASAAFSTPMTRRPASGSGASGPSRRPGEPGHDTWGGD